MSEVRDWNVLGRGSLPALVGLEVLEVGAGRVRSRLAVRPDLLAPNGYLPAASAVALADTSCGYGTVASALAEGRGFTMIELKGNVLGTLTEGVLGCEAALVDGGRTTQMWDARVTAEASGKRLALFRCTQLPLSPR